MRSHPFTAMIAHGPGGGKEETAMTHSRRRREPSVRMSAPRLLEALVKEPGKPARLTLVADTLEARLS